jgi:hypothetical protein
VSEEERDKDVDMLALVRHLLPELTADNVSLLARLLSKSDSGSTQVSDARLNSIVKQFHFVRYKL